ncbi:hypothetical protein [Halopiger xanaduensis]|uniref:Uncharacterized protein n=1 Tax=Halopiger xanaduensis (strain DSM 18323 / JCM 14033 / SH-6) TaxID=797210 RepID=F8DEQ1_HALXS|nr:hypothetical protein [Halopiger xanaduensis]AEH39488.1 hypothetical protein Halxa_0248 [Halopiger xanaduensis SH-6]
MANPEDYFVESEASREGYLWKYYDRKGRPRLTYNPNTVEFLHETFGHKYTIVSDFE